MGLANKVAIIADIHGNLEALNAVLIDIAKKEGGIDVETLSTLAVLLAPFAPQKVAYLPLPLLLLHPL